MTNNINILSVAKKALAMEATAIQELEPFIDASFVQIVEAIHANTGRLVISGIGKSAIIAQKIVATLNSTGSAAIYLHAADAIHGDSGMIHPQDMVMVISKSGESPEIKNLVQLIQQFGNPIIGMVGNTNSYLAQHAHHVINTTVTQEACLNNLAPTSSTTAQMVMGDLLAICLMELNQFDATNFAKFHPGGNLGKRLTLTAGNIAQVNAKPSVHKNTSIKEVIIDISKGRLGATVVTDEQSNVLGIITDGDIRRMLEQHNSIQDLKAEDIYHTNSITIAPHALAIEALNLMEQKDISQLIVAEGQKYIGMIHIHDLMKEGIL
ncbi:MAG: KpsF/GutQ family sugar-phosphate isomerase [Chitinophagia bacterium]|jgi:arabinose-5-phosphate isomerase|nr:KpsF/GutQ family sugar-phosphate isomerase [Chitinophagia bacterium]